MYASVAADPYANLVRPGFTHVGYLPELSVEFVELQLKPKRHRRSLHPVPVMTEHEISVVLGPEQ